MVLVIVIRSFARLVGYTWSDVFSVRIDMTAKYSDEAGLRAWE